MAKKIFISSTYEDLKEERQSAIATIDRFAQAVAMEKFFASRHPSKTVCLNKLQECDAVVLLLGSKYGTIDEEEGISITEIEYNAAKALHLPIFVFLKCNTEGKWHSNETNLERLDKHLAFKAQLDSERYRRSFYTPEHLATEIIGAIYEFERENGELGARLQAFTTWREYFRPFMDKGKIFHHQHTLVGRQDLLEALDSFIVSDRRVFILSGRGGIGKSKILFEFGRGFSSRHWNKVRHAGRAHAAGRSTSEFG